MPNKKKYIEKGTNFESKLVPAEDVQDYVNQQNLPVSKSS